MILISILGDYDSSIIPVSYEFKEKLDTHIIVYDSSKCNKRKAQSIIKGQKEYLSYLKGAEHKVVELTVDDSSYESMMGCVQGIKDMTKNMENVYLNPAGRLHSIAIVLTSELLRVGAKIIAYDRFTNSYNLHTSKGVEHKQIKNSIKDIKIHFQLKGYKLLRYTNKEEVDQRKSTILSLAKNLAGFKAFTEQLQHNKVQNIEGYDSYKDRLKSIGKLNDRVFIQGTVFEEYVYHLLCDNFDFDDVMTGVLIEIDEGIRNEFDILMIKDNHLHTIECKLVNGLNGEHFVYKADLVTEYLDDDGRAMILSIGGKNERYTKSGNKRIQFTYGDRARANYGGIAIHQSEVFDEKAFLDDVKEWFLN